MEYTEQQKHFYGWLYTLEHNLRFAGIFAGMLVLFSLLAGSARADLADSVEGFSSSIKKQLEKEKKEDEERKERWRREDAVESKQCADLFQGLKLIPEGTPLRALLTTKDGAVTEIETTLPYYIGIVFPPVVNRFPCKVNIGWLKKVDLEKNNQGKDVFLMELQNGKTAEAYDFLAGLVLMTEKKEQQIYNWFVFRSIVTDETVKIKPDQIKKLEIIVH